MDRIFVTLLIVVIAVTSFIGLNNWFNSKETTMINTTSSHIEAVKNSIEDNIK
jgi:hypothetical protein